MSSLPTLDERAALAIIDAMDDELPPDIASSPRHLREPHLLAVTLGQLGAQIAHDFNNVLAVALTSVEMAMRINDPAKANAFLANAVKVIGRGRVLTDWLATASHACESPTTLDAHVLIARVCAEDPGAQDGPRIELHCDAERSSVMIDATFFEQALHNLVANARAAGEGAIAVSTRNAPGTELRGEAGRDYLVIAVRDHGAALADDVRSQAFDLFFGMHGNEPGRGIGLAQAKDAVRRTGGIATIESTDIDGTTVVLAIPLVG